MKFWFKILEVFVLGAATGCTRAPNALARVGFPHTTEPAHRPDVVWGPRLEMLLTSPQSFWSTPDIATHPVMVPERDFGLVAL